MYIYIYIYIYIFTSLSISIYVYIQIDIHTHTHHLVGGRIPLRERKGKTPPRPLSAEFVDAATH